MVAQNYAYSRKKPEEEVYLKLMEAELQVRTTAERLRYEDVFAELRARVRDHAEAGDV